MDNEKKKNCLKLGAALTLLLFISLLAWMNQELLQAAVKGDIETIRSIAAKNPFYSYLLTLVLMIIQNSFTIIPLLLIITLNFTLFGFIHGFVWGWLCSLLAATIIFLCVKYIFQERLLKAIKPELIHNIEIKGFSYVFQARIFPFVPTSLVNILAGLSSIHFKDFFWATAIGNFFYFFLLSLIPAGFFTAEINKLTWSLLIICFLVIYYFLKRKWKQKQKALVLSAPEKETDHYHNK